MAQARAAAASAIRVQVVAPERLGATAIAALRARGIEARAVTSDRIALEDPDSVLVAWAVEAVPTLASVVALGETCNRAARAGRPVCLLVPAPPASGGGGGGAAGSRTERVEIERAAAIAYLAAHGAAIGHDVDAWLESIVFAVRFGVPAGAHVAVIAPTGSWLAAQAIALATEAIGLGQRPPVIAEATDEPTDVALFDPDLGAPPASTPSLLVPVVARPELAASVHGPALHTARGAVGAATVLGRAAERTAIGLGPAPREASAELAIDRELLDREQARFYVGLARIGDHPTKTLLKAYQVPITRQAVAETASAAVRIARRAGFPVEIKPFGDDVQPEPAAFVETGVRTDSMVRSAFVNALAAVGRRPDTPGAAVIVRAAPQPGREVAVTFLRLPAVGWTVVIEAPGVPVAAAPCPLRAVDAEALARQAVVASRAGDPEPDRVGLANLVRRASHLVVDLDRRLTRLVLSRVIVGGRGVPTLVVDAYAELV